MKFLCDRCKTRYSIGDDRVRGKILKIRCKNCANVITVREGMADVDVGGDEAGPGAAGERRTRPTTGAPAGSAPAGGALGAAFASQLTKPPPALEQEWYVSIEGAQSGPFTLADAQRWVTSKPFDADLHCWSEGFDDWLAVDKVSHFRGLRKRPIAKTTPAPPIPRVPPRVPAAAAAPVEDEPKPLFAATMASLEKSASAAAAARAPLPAAPARPSSPATKANGTGVAAPMPSSPSATGPKPAPARSGNPNPPVSAGGAALAAAFKLDDPADSMTAVEAPAFRDEIETAAESSGAKRVDRPAPAVEAKPAVTPIVNDRDSDSDDDDGLSIGEVSRVVKLTDLAAMGKPKPRTATSGSQPLARSTGLTAGVAKLSPSELGMNVDPSLAAPEGEPHADESVVARSFASRHRRGMVLLISVSALMVLGVVAAVVFFASGGAEEQLPGGLGGARVIDTSRPEDIVRKQLPPAPNATVAVQKPRWTPRPQGSNTTIPDEPETGNRLDSTEIEAMAAKQNEGTKRCYMRAQKGAMGFEIADVKKIAVTLTITKTGSVSDVQLSSNSGNSFGQCLITRIKAWKFRDSAGGTFRISLAFGS